MWQSKKICLIVVFIAVFCFGPGILNDEIRASSEENTKCISCHRDISDKLPQDHPSFEDLDELSMELIKQFLESREKSFSLDGIHARGGINCSGCHGKELPEADNTVDNETCLSCHGSYEDLSELTANPDCMEKNPHKSHLGELDCTVCHHAHSASESYCNTCHSNFKMGIPGNADAIKAGSI